MVPFPWRCDIAYARFLYLRRLASHYAMHDSCHVISPFSAHHHLGPFRVSRLIWEIRHSLSSSSVKQFSQFFISVVNGVKLDRKSPCYIFWRQPVAILSCDCKPCEQLCQLMNEQNFVLCFPKKLWFDGCRPSRREQIGSDARKRITKTPLSERFSVSFLQKFGQHHPSLSLLI